MVTGKDEHIDALCPGVPQHSSTGRERRARRQDVIEQQDALAADIGILRHGEGVLQALVPLCWPHLVEWARPLRAHERPLQGQALPLQPIPEDQLHLIEAALAIALFMQWTGTAMSIAAGSTKSLSRRKLAIHGNALRFFLYLSA